MKDLIILGSTGSIGTQALDCVDELGTVRIKALTGGENTALMEAQIRKYSPELAAMGSESAARDLRARVADTATRIVSLEDAAAAECDIALSSIVGIAGLVPTMTAIRSGRKRIALANKETLVCAGHLFTDAIAETGCELIPVDSEHSAIFQSLKGGRKNEVKRILLTASGGPFRTKSREELRAVTKRDALKHPNWTMGAKITIDSATMMNKGLEVIEAMHLFSVPKEKITVLIHPESILHSAVEFCDGAVIGQLGTPDMRIPIQLALTYPERKPSPAPALSLADIGRLTFSLPDLEKFDCLRIALEVAGRHDGAPVAMNGANEAAVGLFLSEKIGYFEIAERIERAISSLSRESADSIEKVLEIDREARIIALKD
ncbi:MAG: 1-deoxy-D-xylulose-5-phosphate reductoisomerase [Oscillospiraceae bacterium]|nr:1-deoxy-D-xylulose-5-phosphate reductoisomerase [Oscillospiraceae bacterium]